MSCWGKEGKGGRRRRLKEMKVFPAAVVVKEKGGGEGRFWKGRRDADITRQLCWEWKDGKERFRDAEKGAETEGNTNEDKDGRRRYKWKTQA